MNTIDAIINSALKSREYTDSQIENNVDWEKLKNRPFGETLVEVLPETLIDISVFDAEGMVYVLPGDPIDFVEGEKYTVLYNGKSYESVCHLFNGVAPCLGSTQESYSENEPYLIADGRPMGINLTMFMPRELLLADTSLSEESTWMLGISKSEIKYLDPKYIKDMYGVETTEVLPTVTLTTDEEAAGEFMIETPFKLEEGETYIVNYNGIELECVAWFMDAGEEGAGTFVGNSAEILMNDGTPTEPFAIGLMSMDGEEFGMAMDLLGNTSITIGIKKANIKKIDNKYIDAEWMATTSLQDDEVLFDAVISSDKFTKNDDGYTALIVIGFDEEGVAINNIENIKVGDEYSITLNGNKYHCVAKQLYDDITYLSNADIDNSSTSIPDNLDFVISYINNATDEGINIGLPTQPETDVILKIATLKEKPNKLPIKFLPDGIGGGSVDVDLTWEAIENRPFYSNGIKEDVIMPMTTISYANYLAEFGGFLDTQQKVSFVPGETYIVNYNGTEYEAVCIRGEYQDGLKVNFIGNNGIFGGKDTGHPFLLVEATPMFGTGVGFVPIPDYNPGMSASTTWNISVVKRYEDIHHLETKYIEDIYHTEKGKDVNILLPETAVTYDTFLTEFNAYFINQNMTFNLGEKYIVNINGTEYETHAFVGVYKMGDTDVPMASLGNYVPYGGEDNGLPFTIMDSSLVMGGGIGFGLIYHGVVTQYDTWTISIYQREDTIHKIDSKYIDAEWLPTSYYTNNYTSSYYPFFDVGIDKYHEYISLKPNTKYVVDWNGTDRTFPTSVIVIADGMTLTAIGNIAMMFETGDTGEQYVMFGSEDGVTAIDLTGLNRVSMWFGEFKEIVNKLPEKFLPDIVAKTEDITDHNLSDKSHSDIRGDLSFIGDKVNDINKQINTIKDYTLIKDSDGGHTYVIKVKGGALVTYPKVVGIKVLELPDKLEYLDTDVFDPTGMVVVAVGHDGSEKEITDYDYPEYVSVGNSVYTISYTDCEESFYSSFNITTRSLEEALSDFVYTTNDDGTYTITDWKGTLYGQPSTECIIPNNELIRL